MKGDKLESYQWLKFFEPWGFLVTAGISLLVMNIFMFFVNLNGAQRICFFMASFALMLLGTGLITFAKFPIYRSGRFFTFGMKSMPHNLATHYKWGWRLFLSGVILSLCLFLSK